jgi:phosphoribosylformylglycinamidine synthase subunit PurSL
VTDRNALAAGRRRATAAHEMLGSVTAGLDAVIETELYFIDRDLTAAEQQQLSGALLDPLTQHGEWESDRVSPRLPGPEPVVEIALRPGVTDPTGTAFERAAQLLGLSSLSARSGRRFRFVGEHVTHEAVQIVTTALLHNDIVDEVSIGAPIVARFIDISDEVAVEMVPVRVLDVAGLQALNRDRGLALDPAELDAMQAYFRSIDRDPTDAELETIAQTWSEHCSHKTFRARITWDDGTPVEPLLKQLRRSTDDLARPYVKSAFVDNAGIVAFDDRFDVAVKVETHNHPSAVEPFGGANTGVGGVIRDVLGVAADPIATTDILCFGPLDTAAEDLPVGVLHPQRIRHGVIDGIADYGNKLGLPTVAGAIVHQTGFTANPLVFCGCIGLRPADLVLSGQAPGDRIVVIGGATGRDGIRGATFSSATMDATTGDVAGASVQIGDPITEKLVADVLREARDSAGGPLFTAITDCGAGGFSSAIGELAAELGADVDLDPAPRKYPGLAPWEVWLSEAQERMVLAVHPRHLTALRSIADRHGVLMADLGSFRSDGQLRVTCSGHTIVDLPGSFLHDGRPTRELTASRAVPAAATHVRDVEQITSNATKLLLAVLSHSDVRSNEDVVRGYDHEILGATVGRPYLGAVDDGPADAAVLAPLSAAGEQGLAIAIGMNCRTGVFDAQRMAEAAIDEAVRNAVCVGADPRQLVLLDNFSWGDPRRPETLGQLVDAVAGCVAGAAAFGAPFVSGKDSLNNEYLTSTGDRTAIPPTLVITALGIVPVAEELVTSDAKAAGNALVLIGGHGVELRGSVLDAVLGIDGGGAVPGPSAGAANRYAAVHELMRQGVVRSAHDVSDGGLVTALAEMAMGGRLGVSVTVQSTERGSGSGSTGDALSIADVLFAETSGRLILEVSGRDVEEVCALTGGTLIGVVTADQSLEVIVNGRQVVKCSVEELLNAWRGHVVPMVTRGLS